MTHRLAYKKMSRVQVIGANIVMVALLLGLIGACLTIPAKPDNVTTTKVRF